MSDEMKIGAYICNGCGISERLDSAQLEMTATRDGKAALCKQHDFLCSEAGVKMIQDDIDNEGVNHLVIAASTSNPMSRSTAVQGMAYSPRFRASSAP